MNDEAQHGVGVYAGKQRSADERHQEAQKQYRFLAETVDHQSGRNRHDGIGDEERSRDKARHRQVAQVKVMDNVRNERSQDIGDKRYGEPERHNQRQHS